MIDSHCHLNFIDDNGLPGQLVAEANNAGVGTIINIGTDLGTSLLSVELAQQYESVYAVVGVHPHDARTVNDQLIEKIRKLAGGNKVVAIGEIGLDYYRDHSPRHIQREVFPQMLKLAAELKLPVVIHTREAFEDTMEILKDYAPELPGGVFHCFPGNLDDALAVLEMGFVISVNGVITYKNSKMASLAKEAPLDKIILETDAPYLTPVPHRGQTNRPVLVKYVYEKLAELRSMEVFEVEKIVDRTCRKVFSLADTFGG